MGFSSAQWTRQWTRQRTRQWQLGGQTVFSIESDSERENQAMRSDESMLGLEAMKSKINELTIENAISREQLALQQANLESYHKILSEVHQLLVSSFPSQYLFLTYSTTDLSCML